MGEVGTLSSHVPTATVAQLLQVPGACVIDLRSPAEFALDHVPGAKNVPLFGDDERALIGTLYKRVSADSAFAEARRRTEHGIERVVNAIAAAAAWRPAEASLAQRVRAMTAGGIERLDEELRPIAAERLAERGVILYCWRGGLRSRSVTALVRGLGLERAVALAGGYKEWRRAVVVGLAAWRAPRTFALRGLTGVGKTLVLRELAELQPTWTCDLEGLAGHRSSILGMVGLEPVSQKRFETRLFQRLRGIAAGGSIVFEGESRKVGDCVLPARVWKALDGGANIELVAGTERRIDVLLEDYLDRPENRAELRRQLPFIEQRLGPVRYAGKLVGMLASGQDRELVRLLLERYYDPLYRHSERQRPYAVTIDATDPRAAAIEVARYVEAQRGCVP
jgi:tRNA 2-selenouridine synthase